MIATRLGVFDRTSLFGLGGLAHLALLLSIFAAFVFSIGVLLQAGWDNGMLCFMASACLFITALPVFAGGAKKLFEPIWSVLLIVGTGITGKAFYLIYGPVERTEFLLLGKELKELLFPILVIGGGLLFLAVGYQLGEFRWRLPTRSQRFQEPWDQRKFIAVTGVLTVFGLLFFVLFTKRLDVAFDSLSDVSSKRFVEVEGSTYRGTHGYLRWGAMLLETAFYLVLGYWATLRRRLFSVTGFFVVALGAMAALFPIFVSSRQSLMFVVIRALLIWLCICGEPKPRAVLALTLSGLFVIGSMLAFRRGLSDWEDVRSHVGVSGLLEVTVGGRHFLDLSKTAHVISAVPERVDYQYGRTMLTWLAAPIPRAVWPSKPAVGAGIELGPEIFQTPSGTGVPPGMIGELYLNFGFPGVLIGLLAAGLLLRSLYETFIVHFPAPSFVLIYAVVMSRLSLAALANSFSGSMIKLLMESIPLVVAVYLCANTKRIDKSVTKCAPATISP